jgi:hypothetical protein
MTFRHIETLLHRLHQRRFSSLQKADYEFWGPFAYFEHFHSSRLFFMLRLQNKIANGL